MTTPNAVLTHWFETIGPKGWFVSDPAVDAALAERFGDAVEAAMAGGLDHWAESRDGALALVLLLDQFPRNLFRGQARAFEGDARALAVADAAIAQGWDLETDEPARHFFYLPFEHAEDLAAQDRAVAFCAERINDGGKALHHAEAHRDLIRRFARFPHRNAALGRPSTEEERAHLASGGYQPGAAPKKPNG